jgi:cytochrome o ubiquinol oxidase subunit 1
MGMFIAGWSFVGGFALVWHINWLAIVSILGLIITIIVRLTDDHVEYTIPAAEVRKMERRAMREGVKI